MKTKIVYKLSDYLTVQETVDKLQRTRQRVYDYARADGWHSVKHRGARLFLRADVEKTAQRLAQMDDIFSRNKPAARLEVV